MATPATISLIQGSKYAKREAKFKSHFNGEKIVENFTGDNNAAALANFAIVEQKVQEIDSLQQQYQAWSDYYVGLQTNASDSAGKAIAPKNEYNGKNVVMTDAIYYITDEGNMKWWPNPEILSASFGKYGVPDTQVDSGLDANNLPAGTNLKMGSAMRLGQSVGHEGSNVFVDRATIKPSGQYQGCFAYSQSTTLLNTENMLKNVDGSNFNTYESCLAAAGNNNNKWFGLSNSYCYGSNEDFTPAPLGLKMLWHSDTASSTPGNVARVTNDGHLIVESSSGDLLYKTPNPDRDCSDWGGGQTLQSNPDYQCAFFLTLQGDYNMCIKNGSPVNWYGASWCTMTNGQSKGPNPLWVASKGKTGVETLSTNDAGLSANEWIGSVDGGIQLIMQEDGDLVLYTADPSTYTAGMQTCVKDADGNEGGRNYSYALYQNVDVADNSRIGQVGYITEDSIMKLYPAQSVGRGTTYKQFPGMDSGGNDLGASNGTLEECEAVCNANAECAGYVYQAETTTCFPKNNKMYPVGGKQALASTDMYVRDFTVDNDISCNKDISAVDSERMSHYLYGGVMRSNAKCGLASTVAPMQGGMKGASQQLQAISKQIVEDINFIMDQNDELIDKMGISKSSYAEMAKQYETSMVKLTDQRTQQGVTNHIVDDTGLYVTHENFMYGFWLFLMIALVFITIGFMRK